ncbi:MAG: hypothetical protein WC740_22075 [Verrucomicrobiia bacterium]
MVFLVLIVFVAITIIEWIAYNHRQKSPQPDEYRFPWFELVVLYAFGGNAMGMNPPWGAIIFNTAVVCILVAHRLSHPVAVKYGKWVESLGFRLGQTYARILSRWKH